MVAAVLTFAAFVSCSDSTPSERTGPPEVPTDAVSLTAHALEFDRDTFTLLADANVEVRLSNEDDGVVHNFSLYESGDLAVTIYSGPLVTGPAEAAYRFRSPSPGTYFFRCDVHPTTMTGTLVTR